MVKKKLLVNMIADAQALEAEVTLHHHAALGWRAYVAAWWCGQALSCKTGWFAHESDALQVATTWMRSHFDKETPQTAGEPGSKIAA